MLRRQNSELPPSTLPLGLQHEKLFSSLSLDSDDVTFASAPLPEAHSFKNPITQLELTVSASSLLNLDQLTRSDPLCVVFLHDSTTAAEWIEIGRTESIPNNLNPEWRTKFLVDYRFEEKQMLTFMVFDKDCAKYSLENHDFLGTLECSLAEIVSAPHSKLTRSLRLPSIHSTAKRESTITILADEAGDCKKFIVFQMTCATLLKSTGNSGLARFKSEAECRKMFINISKQLVDGSWILLHRTERLTAGEADLMFAPVNLRYSSVCRQGNLEMPLRFQLHQVKQSFRGKSSKLIAESHTNFIEISEKCNEDTPFTLNLVSKIPDGTKKDYKLIIYHFKIEAQKTFMDYIQGGLQMKFAVAIDFTASNGEPTSHSSLHYKHGKRDNPYVMTLKIVGEILQDYSTPKQFYAYGFGAKGYPVANRVNNKFALNFKETNPLCTGIDGVLGAYYRALQRVKLFGPTCFAPVIREITEKARNSMMGTSLNKEYYVLLILTDGIVCDPETTMDALVEASETPMSVIIIGIGDEDFTTMEKFDSDEKMLRSRSNKRAIRDIVQFVELRKYVNFKSVIPISEGSKIALARSVLAELPQQVVGWMNLCRK